MITLQQAKDLKRGDILYYTKNKNADGSMQRWKVNGKVKTWKRKRYENCVRVPIKYGMYTYGYLTEQELHLVSL